MTQQLQRCVSRDLLVRFINELQVRAKDRRRSSGKELTIIVELLVKNENALTVYMEDLIGQVLYPQNIYFIDFPMQERFVGYARGDGLHHIAEFLAFRQKMNERVPLSHLVPMPSDHDFGLPLKNASQELILMALHEFFSFNPSITHHGSEQSGLAQSHRPLIDHFHQDGDKLKMQRAIAKALGSMQAARSTTTQFEFIHHEQDTLIVKRLIGEKSLVLMINRKADPHILTSLWSKEDLNRSRMIFSTAPIHSIETLPPDSIVILEMNEANK